MAELLIYCWAGKALKEQSSTGNTSDWQPSNEGAQNFNQECCAWLISKVVSSTYLIPLNQRSCLWQGQTIDPFQSRLRLGASVDDDSWFRSAGFKCKKEKIKAWKLLTVIGYRKSQSSNQSFENSKKAFRMKLITTWACLLLTWLCGCYKGVQSRTKWLMANSNWCTDANES